MRLAHRNLLRERTRFALSILGVALAEMLVLLLSGFLTGIYRQISTYLEQAPGSVVVAQEGVENLLLGASVLPPGTGDAVRATDGVAAVAPILSQFVVLDLRGAKQPAYLVGYDPALGGGPARLATGREPEADDEVILDRVLAERNGLKVGDGFELVGRRLTIVGLSEGTTSWMTSFLFIRKSAAEALLRAPSVTSYLLVVPAEGLAAESVLDRLKDLPGSEVILKRDVIANDAAFFGRIFNPPIQLMAAIAFLVGTLVVGLVIYTATVERQREYGVLKAIGARNRTLYRVVTTQALIAAGAGSLLGVALAVGGAQLIMTVRPQFLITLEAPGVAGALLAGLGMAVLAALAPARVIAGLAPADAFRR